MSKDMPRPADHREVPEGFRLAAVEDKRWRVADGKRCRMLERTAAGQPRACGQPSAAEFNRGRHTATRGRVDSFWAYCEAHMFGRWVEDGKVMVWILEQVSDKEVSGA